MNILKTCIFHILLLLLLILNKTFSVCLQQNNSKTCNMKISKSAKDLFSNTNLIFNSKEVDKTWKGEEQSKSYNTSSSIDFDYFYIVIISQEDDSKEQKESQIEIEVKSKLNVTTSVKKEINSKSDKKSLYKEVEVEYSCGNESYNEGLIKMTMKVKSYYCDEIEIVWFKDCSKSEKSEIEDLNIGLFNKPSILLVKNGKKESNFNENMIISEEQSMIKLLLYSSDKEIEIEEPRLVYDERLMSIILKLDYVKITKSKVGLMISFECKEEINDYSDVELIIQMKSSSVQLSSIKFKKYCNTFPSNASSSLFTYLILFIICVSVILYGSYYFILVHLSQTSRIKLNSLLESIERLSRSGFIWIDDKICLLKEYILSINYSSIDIENDFKGGVYEKKVKNDENFIDDEKKGLRKDFNYGSI